MLHQGVVLEFGSMPPLPPTESSPLQSEEEEVAMAGLEDGNRKGAKNISGGEEKGTGKELGSDATSSSRLAFAGPLLLAVVIGIATVWYTLVRSRGANGIQVDFTSDAALILGETDATADAASTDASETGLRAQARGKSSASSKPNIVFILADDLGFNSIGNEDLDLAYATPYLSALARESVTIQNYYTQESECRAVALSSPRRCCLF